MLEIRGASPKDASAIYNLLAGDTELALSTASIPIPYTIKDAHAFLSKVDPRETFAIVVDGEFVGMIGMIIDGGKVEVGYWMGRAFWGKGYATNALQLLISEARNRKITRLAAEVFPGNTASKRVLEKNGFVYQGDTERNLPLRGGLRQMMHFECELG